MSPHSDASWGKIGWSVFHWTKIVDDHYNWNQHVWVCMIDYSYLSQTLPFACKYVLIAKGEFVVFLTCFRIPLNSNHNVFYILLRYHMHVSVLSWIKVSRWCFWHVSRYLWIQAMMSSLFCCDTVCLIMHQIDFCLLHSVFRVQRTKPIRKL